MVKQLELAEYLEFPRQELVGKLPTVLLLPYHLHGHLKELGINQ